MGEEELKNGDLESDINEMQRELNYCRSRYNSLTFFRVEFLKGLADVNM